MLPRRNERGGERREERREERENVCKRELDVHGHLHVKEQKERLMRSLCKALKLGKCVLNLRRPKRHKESCRECTTFERERETERERWRERERERKRDGEDDMSAR